MPWLFFKGQVCADMGWTFQEFDKQSADEVLQYYSLKEVYLEIMETKREHGS